VTLADRAALVELGRPVAGSNPVVHPSRDAWGRIIISRAFRQPGERDRSPAGSE
jgi:hypothetical protein